MSAEVVLGIGLSSAATVAEVQALVESALREHGLGLADVATVATRVRFETDPRLQFGPPVTGFSDDDLARASAPTARAVGPRFRVAETAALLAGAGTGRLLGRLHRSDHVTLALVATTPAHRGVPAAQEHRGVPAAQGHGGDGSAVAAALGLDLSEIVDLSASMNPFAPDVGAAALVRLAGDTGLLRRYPDAGSATALLAEAMQVDADLLVLTNGGSEAIALVAAEQPSGWLVEPEFSLYRRHLDSLQPGAPRWRSNPSNPLGCLAAPDDRADVWDEAFYPLATGRWSRGDESCWRLGSLTKLWDCAGLRLGYVVAPTPEAAGMLRRRQSEWAVNALALNLLPDLLAATDLAGWAQAIASSRAGFCRELDALGFDVTSTAGPWVLLERAGLRDQLAPHGVIVRDCTSFGLPGLHRVAVPRPADHDRVMGALSAVARS